MMDQSSPNFSPPIHSFLRFHQTTPLYLHRSNNMFLYHQRQRVVLPSYLQKLSPVVSQKVLFMSDAEEEETFFPNVITKVVFANTKFE